jgi:chromosome segregation ATPase
MASTVDQRLKDLTEPSTLASDWAGIKSSFKELDAPIFRSAGDLAGATKRYDAAAKTFLDFVKKKDDAKDIFATIKPQMDSIGTKIDDMKKEIQDTGEDAATTIKKIVDPQTVEEGLQNVTEYVKAQQDLNKERKAIFDTLNKLYESYLKALIETRDKVKAALDAANAGLNRANSELVALEAQIRNAVVAYQKVAISMNRKDIADAVRKLSADFGK